MGLFDFFKKKDNNKRDKSDLIKEMIGFSTQALSSASSDIEEHGTFLPFGAVLTSDKTLKLVVYHDPEKDTIDPREHATTIQKLIAKEYDDPKCVFCHMAFDGVSHLKSGDIDSINVRVSHKPSNTHNLFSYTYKVENGKINLLNPVDPIINEI